MKASDVTAGLLAVKREKERKAEEMAKALTVTNSNALLLRLKELEEQDTRLEIKDEERA